MAKKLQLRRGTTSQHSSFTGAVGEVTVDTDKDTVVVHDGSTAGGTPLAKESAVPALLDQDDFSSDSATAVASQQSIKAYVDTADALKAPLASPTFTGTVTCPNLNVTGTTTTINTSTLDVEDKQIEIGKVSTPSDTTADEGGIVLKGASDKSIKWLDSSDNWTSSESWDLASGKHYHINNVSVLSSTTLGSGVVSSSLTSLGTIASLTATATNTGDIDFNGSLIEKCKVTAGKLSDNTNINLEDGHVCLFTTAESTTSTPNIRYSSSTTLDSKMAVGDSIAVVLITTSHANGYSAQLTIDGSAVTEEWNGGSAPSAGTGSGLDVYSYTIIKTAANTYTVLAGMVNFA